MTTEPLPHSPIEEPKDIGNSDDSSLDNANPSRPFSTPLLWRDEDAAAWLQVPVASIRNAYRVGQLKGLLVGRHLRFHPDDIQTFVSRLREVGE